MGQVAGGTCALHMSTRSTRTTDQPSATLPDPSTLLPPKTHLPVDTFYVCFAWVAYADVKWVEYVWSPPK